MTARTHDVIALASLVTIAAYYPPEHLTVTTLIIALIANNIGALIPDLDSATNRLWDLLPAGDFLAKIFNKVFWKHRTLSHSLIGAIILYLVIQWLLPKFLQPNFIDLSIITAAITIGYVSHLVADSFTKEGLPLLFPININFGIPPLEALRIKTGGWIEKTLVYPGTIIFLIWFSISHQPQLVNLFRSITN